MRSAQVRCPSEKFSNHAVSLSGLGDSAWILYLGELIVLEAEKWTVARVHNATRLSVSDNSQYGVTDSDALAVG